MKVPSISGLLCFGTFALGALSCAEDEDPFLPLAELCEVYAQEICDARASCCGQSSEGCEAALQKPCMESADQFAAEGTLRYDGRRASRIRGQLRDAVQACGAPVPLGRFFEGTLAVGEGCERASQCDTQSCLAAMEGGALVCSDPAPVQLCDPADI